MKIDYNSQNNLHIKLPLLEVGDVESKSNIAKISNLNFSLENMHPEAYGWKISAEKRMEVKSDLIYVFACNKFVEKLLTILGYINQTPEENGEEKKNFISQFIAKKVPNHPIFNTY